MPFATHPGGFLKRELKRATSVEIGSRSISAYRPVALRTYSMDAGRSLLIQPSGSVDILEIVPSSGLICRANTTSLSLSVSVVLRSRAVCDQRMRREV